MAIPTLERTDEVVTEMNVVPLIDVLLVLLVMLIITIPIQTHAVKLDMPQLDVPSATEPPPIVSIDVDFDGTLGWNGQPLHDPEELIRRFRREARNPFQAEYHIRPNALVEYRHVIAVLAAAQRNGITQIGLVGNERFLE